MTTVVFVHGWGVTDTATYGQMPARLQRQAAAAGLPLQLADIWLSEYVTFDDAVTMGDLVRAFDHALRDLQLDEPRFACITHSAGGPVVREWRRAQRQNPHSRGAPSLTHLVMLAPANFGSALAQLGKGVLGRLKAWFDGVEPGQRILDWLELGSAGSLALNLDHIHGEDSAAAGEYLFVLTGDRPDRSLYDHLNSYTGEDGSDGVVRLAAANLNARHAVLAGASSGSRPPDSLWLTVKQAPRSAFKMIPGAAHSGQDLGILRSAAPITVESIVRCLQVRSNTGYAALCDAFERENADRDAHRVELEPAGPFAPRVHIHDPCSMLIVRLGDEAGEPLRKTGFLLGAGADADPDLMPVGFLLDRQANSHHPNTISLFLDHSLLAGTPRVADPRNTRTTLRPAVVSHRPYSALIDPADLVGMVHHAVARSRPDNDLFDLLGPHQTTILDVVLPRKIHVGLFRLTRNLTPQSFRRPVAGKDLGGDN